MSTKDYNSISQNLKQQIDILKTGNELTGSTAGSVSIGSPCTSILLSNGGIAVGDLGAAAASGGDTSPLWVDTDKNASSGDKTSDQTIWGGGIGSSDVSPLSSRVGGDQGQTAARGSDLSIGGSMPDRGAVRGENIKIHDRLLNFTTSERGDRGAAPTNFFLDYYYYIYLILLIVILFLIYIFIKLLKPSYIYKNVLRENKKNKYKDIDDIDYNKMYNIISVIYIVILILLFINKQKIDYTIEYILKKIY